MQKRQGISLIVLVITIIVMIIVAGAIILSLNNNGIIAKAEQAVEQTNLATIREVAQMAWAEAYAGGERTEEALKAAVDKALVDAKADTTKYKVTVTKSGVTVELKGTQKGWVQDRLTVTNGTITLEVGDYVNYVSGATVRFYDEDLEEVEGAYEEDYGGRWQVLGANEEGELLIVQEVQDGLEQGLYLSDEQGTPEGLIEAQNDWLTGIQQLDDVCIKYKNGKGATGARSIRIEDIDRVTGYDKTTYGKGTLSEYGNEVTYYYNGTHTLDYVSSNGLEGIFEGTEGVEDYLGEDRQYIGFHYYTGKEFVGIEETDLESGPVGEEITTLKSDYYSYNPIELGLMEENNKAYLMLFSHGYYWLANNYTKLGEDNLYGIYSVTYGVWDGSDGNCVGLYLPFWNSYGPDYVSETMMVRAVVTLSLDVELTGSSADGWDIK